MHSKPLHRLQTFITSAHAAIRVTWYRLCKKKVSDRLSLTNLMKVAKSSLYKRMGGLMRKGRMDAKNDRYSTSEYKTSTWPHVHTVKHCFAQVQTHSSHWYSHETRHLNFPSSHLNIFLSLYLKRPLMSLTVWIFPSLAPTIEKNPLAKNLQLTLFEPCEMATANEWRTLLNLLASLKLAASKWRIFLPQLHSHHLLVLMGLKIRNGWFKNKAPGGQGSTHVETHVYFIYLTYIYISCHGSTLQLHFKFMHAMYLNASTATSAWQSFAASLATAKHASFCPFWQTCTWRNTPKKKIF